MKTTVVFGAVVVCFLCLAPGYTDAAPADLEEERPGITFFDRIFNIPRSVISSVNKNLNENGAKCADGSPPVNVDGKGTCHDTGLAISRSALDSVNDFLNG